jgi:DNA polymerase-4
MRWPRTVLHADMDAFYAAVEQRDRPELRGRPVIVGHPGRRGVVTTASYEARPFGVGSAMPMAQAVRRCPDAIVVPPRFEHYSAVSREVMEVFGRFSPIVEPLSLDEAFLEMTGAEPLFGSPAEMGARLKRAVFERTGLRVSVGLAPTKYVAKVASDADKPDGLTVVPPESVLDFLWPRPVAHLWGVGPVAGRSLAWLGLHTIGDVARADPDRLRAELGSLGAHVAALARGEDPRRVVSGREAKSVGAEETLEHDVVGVAAIRPHLVRSADRIARRLRAAGLVARGVRVKLKTHRFQSMSRQTSLGAPTANADLMLAAADVLLGRFDLSVPMRLVGLAAFELWEAASAPQTRLFGPDGRAEREGGQRRDRLDHVLDAMRDRFGDHAVRRADDLGMSARKEAAPVLPIAPKGRTP